MNIDALLQHCFHIIQSLNEELAWSLQPNDLTALADAILPHVSKAADQSDEIIRTIARNYWKDGPMVEQMLSAETPDHEMLWGMWREKMLRWIAHKGVESEEQEEFVQNVYIQTRKALSTFNFRSQLQTYLIGITNNCWRMWNRDRIQAASRIDAHSDALDRGDAEQEIRDSDSSFETALELEQARQVVHQIMTEIVKGQTLQILYLYYGEKDYIDEETNQKQRWTDQKIGEKLGKSARAIFSQRKRSIDKLRQDPRLKAIAQEYWGINFDDLDE
ncbi:sigma-70 family RNA polymerase sigma factor [Chloroflexi bacterium TSY]|nr:sigma-70 family RNA polymerase sigma factor [Chloroflexi bacterium TSY]